MKNILIKYIEGKPLTKEEQSALNSWLDESDSNQYFLTNLKNHWDISEVDVDLSRFKVWQKIKSESNDDAPPIPKSNSHRHIYAVAASIALVLCFSLSILLKKPAFLYDRHSSTNSTVALVIKSANEGEKRTIKLPDSTIVKLNSGSEIHYPESFDSDKRLVQLSGEAFFDVVPDKSRPFIIESEHMQIRVVGTSFNVKAYRDQSRMTVAVKSGTVEVKNPTNTLKTVLEKDQMLSICEKEQLFKKERITDDLIAFGWVDNYLIFDDLKLAEAMRLIANWYGISYEISEELHSDKKITAKWKNPTLKNVMENISHAYEFEYELKDRFVLIK